MMEGANTSTVLVVHNAPDQIETMSLLLRDHNYTVITAAGGREGLRAALRERPDLVICDASSPLTRSVRICSSIREHPEITRIPVLAVKTADGASKTEVEWFDAGVDDYLEAPYDPRQLLAKVAQLIGLKRAKEELHECEERYHVVAGTTTDVIVTIDENSTILFVNESVESVFGYAVEELVGRPITILIPDYLQTAHVAGVGEAVQTGRKQVNWTAVELSGRHKSGRDIPVEISFGEFVKNGKHLITGIARDITERKQLEERLRQTLKLEAIGRLAGGLAHDFNNLITVIAGYSDLAIRWLQPEDPLWHSIEEIKLAGERAASLTRQLLAFSRRQVLQPRVLDLNTLVSEMERMLRRLIGEDVAMRTVLDPELGSIKADPGQIEQVIMNLVVNARDAMPNGGKLTVETKRVDIEEEYASQKHVSVKSGPYVMLAVSDTGSGMDEQTRSRIFEPFFTTKETGKGTGLGLSTVYGIVRQSGGNIWVYSEINRGTTFKIYLPCVPGAPQEYKRNVDLVQTFMGSETILLAEDDETVRNLVREVLERCGHRVLEAPNGGSALLICERYKEPIHLLLTDVVMPEMSGRELANRLARIRADMRVLYMSGYTDDSIVHHGILESGIPFIQKPFTPATLARKVRETLDAQ
jgi:PAS domain S-box-containing protein